MKNGFELHTLDNAPVKSRAILEGLQSTFGFVPNLYAVLAESPAATEAYRTLAEIVMGRSSLSPAEQHVVFQTINRENGCHYCVAAHGTIAETWKLDPSIDAAIRGEQLIDEPKLRALQSFTETVFRERGWVPDDQVGAFLDAGYTRAHVLDVIVVFAMKTLSNYTNHLADTPVDREFGGEAAEGAA